MKRIIYILGVSLILGGSLGACHKKQVVCPGLGQSEESDFSPFNEDGTLKEDGKGKKAKKGQVGRFDSNTGLITKKNPKGQSPKRKTRLY